MKYSSMLERRQLISMFSICLWISSNSAMDSARGIDPHIINKQLRVKLRNNITLNEQCKKLVSSTAKGFLEVPHVEMPHVPQDKASATPRAGPALDQIYDRIKELLSKGGFVLHWLAYFGYEDVFKFIIDQNILTRAQLVKLLNVPLAIPDYDDAFELNLSNDPVIAADGFGLRPLHIAIIHQPYPIISLVHNHLIEQFLEYGAEIEARTQSQHTPLHLAVQCRNQDLAHILIEHGADVNALAPHENILHLVERNKTELEQMTPLFFAAAHGDLVMVELLVEHSALVVFATSTLGETPLHHAVAYNREDVVHCLLDHGADPRACIKFSTRARQGVVTSRSVAAIDLARQLHHDRLIPLLQSRAIGKSCCLIL